MLHEELNQGYHRLELWPLGKTGAHVNIKVLRCRTAGKTKISYLLKLSTENEFFLKN